MNQLDLEARLKDLPLGEIRFFQQITSTNEEAAHWIKAGCPDLSLIVADEQTAGRGRGGRKWFTPAGSALAFSLVLRSPARLAQLLAYQNTARLNGLGALAVCQALQKEYQLPVQIKWPNDVISDGQKLSGVLAEAHWMGSELQAVVLGIGINIARAAVPPADWDTLNPQPFPATCVEALLGRPVRRLDLLYAVIEALLTWWAQIADAAFLRVWQENLAFWDEWVQIISPGLEPTVRLGKLVALEDDGALQVREKSGAVLSLRTGEIHPADPPLGGFHLRPVDSL